MYFFNRSQESYSRAANNMPWLSVGWNHGAARQELASALAVQGIPALRLITSRGAIPVEARHHITGDPDGLVSFSLFLIINLIYKFA